MAAASTARRDLRALPHLLPLYARAAAGLLPGVALLPWVPGGGGALPALELSAERVLIERGRLRAYNAVCGFAQATEVPSTYLHILAFPLQMALMADGRFPFSPVGLVHIENEISQHERVPAGAEIALSARTGALAAHPRGTSFEIEAQARVEGQLIWSERSVMLKVGARAGQGASAPGTEPAAGLSGAGAAAEGSAPAQEQEWDCPADLGRRYGAVSGDRNPIHMHPLAARLFGFPRAIAHGMWSKARCVAALADQLPERYSVQVSFRRPILLPAQVRFQRFAAADGAGAVAFALRNAAGDQLHLQGAVRPL